MSAARWSGGAEVALTAFDEALMTATLTAPEAGEHVLELVTAEGTRAQVVVVTPRVDAQRSEVYVRELHVPAMEAATRTVRIRFRLRDANQRVADACDPINSSRM